MSAAPIMASRVLPDAVRRLAIRESGSEKTVPVNTRRLAKKAPAKIPAPMRYPSARTAASAMPVAGQTGVALVCSRARKRDSLAAMK